jgi:WD40 repeat protein
MVQRLKLHKVLIQSLSFSNNEKYLASLGGQDDNTLVIWDVRIINYYSNFNLFKFRLSQARRSVETPSALIPPIRLLSTTTQTLSSSPSTIMALRYGTLT